MTKVSKVNSPKVLLLDIETLPNKGYFFSLWDGLKPDMITQEKSILTFSYKWLGEKKVNSLSILNYLDTKKGFDPYFDAFLVTDIIKILNEADYVVGHYSDKFDMRFIRARALINGLEPPPPISTIDTYKLAKKHFNFNANRLDYLGKLLGHGGKMKMDWSCWQKCAEGDVKAIKKMEEYNRHDVDLLEDVFLTLLPHCDSKLNFNLFAETDIASCHHCGSFKVQKRGHLFSKISKRQRYQCQKCYAWFSTRMGK